MRFWVPELLEDYATIVHERGATLPAAYTEAVVVAGAHRGRPAPRPPCPCHNDLLSGNVIRARADGRMLIVDWEYAGMGDPRFDLGNLSINNDFDERTDDRLLAAYYGEPPSGRPSRRAGADARAVRRPRGGLGRRAGPRCQSSTSTSRATAGALRAAARGGRRAALRRVACRRGRVSFPTARAW